MLGRSSSALLKTPFSCSVVEGDTKQHPPSDGADSFYENDRVAVENQQLRCRAAVITMWKK